MGLIQARSLNQIATKYYFMNQIYNYINFFYYIVYKKSQQVFYAKQCVNCKQIKR